jgi:hypothetical protein
MKETAKNSVFFKIGLSFLILVPALVVLCFGYRIQRYHALLEKYECNRDVCEADFNGDGVPGTLSIDRTAPAPDFDSWLVVRDSGKELLREPRRSIDNSLKTHVAVISESRPARVIVYDHIFDHKPSRSLVLAYNGKSMMQQSPSEKDNEVLAAMGAVDETGTYERWILFQLLAVPALIGYYIILAIVGRRMFYQTTKTRYP